MSGIEGLLAGRTLGGRYRVEEVIGRGGMGTVYRATDQRLGRQVAVKVITVPGLTDSDARDRVRARFRREAAAAARLPHHPNVVPVYDYGTDEALSLDYLVMELLRGEDLSAQLAGGRMLPLPAALAILHEAAEGVAVGHRSGLIHRDVKPGNIFLVRTGRENEVQVRVLDFGIAKLMTEEETAGGLTQDGRTPHSPAFASPEQLRGAANLTPGSDVYSLGVVGFHLLTGTRPFDDAARNRMALGMTVQVPDLRARNPSVPREVAALVTRSLSPDPADRPADAGAFARDLAAARGDLGASTIPPYLPGIAGGTGDAGAPTGADDDRTVALPPEGAAAADRDDHTIALPPPDSDEGTVALPPAAAPAVERAAHGPVPPRRPRRERRSLAPAIVTVLLVGALAGGLYWFWSQEMQPERPVVVERPEVPDIEIDDPDDIPDEPGPLDAFMADQEGRRYFRQGDWARAAELFGRAVEIQPDDPDYRTNYGQALLRLGETDAARDQLERAVRMNPNRARPYEPLSQVLLAEGDTAGAIGALERVIALTDDPRQLDAAGRRLEELRAATAAPPSPEPTPPPAAPDTFPAPPDTLPPSG
jgi:tRNA A-37 threonylcarbamoyl transferase component Bud32